MRFYCLTSISKVEPLPNSEENFAQSENGENDELMKYANSEVTEIMEYLSWIDRQNSGNENGHEKKNDMYFNSFMAYRLTEICFGYKYYLEEEKRHYVMEIYQNKIREPFSTLMIKGAISVTEVSDKKYAFDLRLATSRLSRNGEKLDFDIIVKIRNIKNTQTKGLLSQEEEDYYEKYAQSIAEICKSKTSNYWSHDSMNDAWEDALDELTESQPFKLSNESKIKFLQQKIRDMKSMITLLCDPETGSYKNMPLPKIVTDPRTMKVTTTPCRFDQKVECLLYEKQKQWRTEKTSNRKQAKNYRDCPEIFWIKPNLNEINLDGVNFGNLWNIYIKKADLNLSRKYIHPIMREINYNACKELRLIKCNILELSDEFLNLLPSTLESINLRNNNITFISKNISKFYNLKSLHLSKNRNLVDIPWTFLPPSVEKLYLEKTNIKVIPSEIQRFRNLSEIFVSSNQLQNISWKNLNMIPSLSYISFEGGGLAVNDEECDLINTKLCQIKIANVGLKKMDVSKLPSTTLQFLELPSNNFEQFYLEKDTIAKLYQINLENNQLKTLSFGEMFTSLTSLFIDQNQLTSIEFISFLPNLEILSAKNNKIQEIPETFGKALFTIKLDFNEISQLPKNFENFMSSDDVGVMQSPHLSLSFNNFDYFKSDLDEVLWKRLPKKLEILNLCGNDLVYIPGTLCQKTIRYLFVDNCNLQHICPILYTHVAMKKEKEMAISLCENPNLEFLPFIPFLIYQKAPSYREKISFESLYNLPFAIITDNEDFINSSKFPTNNFKPIYDFENYYKDEETKYGCKCCAICGKATEEKEFRSLMIMDFAICFETDIPSYEHYEQSLKFPCFKSGQWKTIVKSRLCQECKIKFHEENDKAFEEYQNYQKQKSHEVSNKRKAKNMAENNQQISCSSTKKTFYETEFVLHHDDAINHERTVEDNFDVEFPLEIFTGNEESGGNEGINYSMDFTYDPSTNNQTFPTTSTHNFYSTPNLGIDLTTIPPQSYMDFTDNTQNSSQAFYQNFQQNEDNFQPQFQSQYITPNSMPILPQDTIQNNYIENIVLLDNQGNYLTTFENNEDNFPNSTGYNTHILNPENY